MRGTKGIYSGGVRPEVKKIETILEILGISPRFVGRGGRSRARWS
jgi:hypothetical protein